MKRMAQWVALAAVILVLFISDILHLAASRFNVFLFILLGMIAGLIVLVKATGDRSD